MMDWIIWWLRILRLLYTIVNRVSQNIVVELPSRMFARLCWIALLSVVCEEFRIVANNRSLLMRRCTLFRRMKGLMQKISGWMKFTQNKIQYIFLYLSFNYCFSFKISFEFKHNIQINSQVYLTVSCCVILGKKNFPNLWSPLSYSFVNVIYEVPSIHNAALIHQELFLNLNII